MPSSSLFKCKQFSLFKPYSTLRIQEPISYDLFCCSLTFIQNGCRSLQPKLFVQFQTFYTLTSPRLYLTQLCKHNFFLHILATLQAFNVLHCSGLVTRFNIVFASCGRLLPNIPVLFLLQLGSSGLRVLFVLQFYRFVARMVVSHLFLCFCFRCFCLFCLFLLFVLLFCFCCLLFCICFVSALFLFYVLFCCLCLLFVSDYVAVCRLRRAERFYERARAFSCALAERRAAR